MPNSKIVIVSEDPVIIHRGQEFAQTLGVQCEVRAPGYEGFQSVPNLSSGSSPVDTGSVSNNVVPFPGRTQQQESQSVSKINDLEAQAIEKAIYAYRGNLTEAAKALGIGRATLYRKVKLYNIDPSLARRRRSA